MAQGAGRTDSESEDDRLVLLELLLKSVRAEEDAAQRSVSCDAQHEKTQTTHRASAA